MDIPGYTLSRTTLDHSRRIPHRRTRKPICADYRTSCFIPRNPILLLCISRRTILRSICIPHLPLAFGTAAISGHPSPHLHNRQATLVPPHQYRCLCGGRRQPTGFIRILL